MGRPKSNIKRIRAIEGSLVLFVIGFLFFKGLLYLLKNLPSSDIGIIFWGTGILFLSFLIGISFGLFIYYLIYLLDNFLNDFFKKEKFRKVSLIVIGIFLVLAFLVSSGVVIFSKPLKDIESIMTIVAAVITSISGIIVIIIKLKKLIRTKK